MEADLGSDLWLGPDHWDSLHFAGFSVGISFIITECYVNIASNHPSVRIAALRSLHRIPGPLESLPSPGFSLPPKSTCCPPWLTPWPGFLPDSTPPPPHCLICCSLLTGSLPSDYILAGDPPSLVSSWTWTKTVRQFLWWRNPSYQVQIMVTTWNSCPQSLQALPVCSLRDFFNISRFHQIIPLWLWNKSLRHVGTAAVRSFGWTKEFGGRWEEGRGSRKMKVIFTEHINTKGNRFQCIMSCVLITSLWQKCCYSCYINKDTET